MTVMKPREIEKDIFILNGRPFPVSEFQPEEAVRYPSVYEVIRVIQGVPLFWEAHLDRLQKSLSLAGSSLAIPREELQQEILDLIRENKVAEHNFKIIFNGFENGGSFNRYLFFVTSRYPTEQQLKQGVTVVTHQAVRENPNAKIIATSFRTPVLAAIQQAGAYEALLVNHQGEVTEGSRSNFFLLRDGIFYTPPADRILEGITRQVVIRLLERLGYSLVTQPITINFLRKADALFLTGTSPGVLPIQQLDDQLFRTNLKPLQDLQSLFHHFVQTYIQIHQE